MSEAFSAVAFAAGASLVSPVNLTQTHDRPNQKVVGSNPDIGKLFSAKSYVDVDEYLD